MLSGTLVPAHESPPKCCAASRRRPPPLPPGLLLRTLHLHNAAHIPVPLMLSLQRFTDDAARDAAEVSRGEPHPSSATAAACSSAQFHAGVTASIADGAAPAVPFEIPAYTTNPFSQVFFGAAMPPSPQTSRAQRRQSRRYSVAEERFRDSGAAAGPHFRRQSLAAVVANGALPAPTKSSGASGVSSGGAHAEADSALVPVASRPCGRDPTRGRCVLGVCNLHLPAPPETARSLRQPDSMLLHRGRNRARGVSSNDDVLAPDWAGAHQPQHALDDIVPMRTDALHQIQSGRQNVPFFAENYLAHTISISTSNDAPQQPTSRCAPSTWTGQDVDRARGLHPPPPPSERTSGAVDANFLSREPHKDAKHTPRTLAVTQRLESLQRRAAERHRQQRDAPTSAAAQTPRINPLCEVRLDPQPATARSAPPFDSTSDAILTSQIAELAALSRSQPSRIPHLPHRRRQRLDGQRRTDLDPSPAANDGDHTCK